tara:strand:- start:252 stop:788 length:537 start_codon:yes stop_codon:yes gene_type:complete
MLKTIDNFLSLKDFLSIQKMLKGEDQKFPWYFQKTIYEYDSHASPEFMFFHLFNNDNKANSSFNDYLKPFYKKVYETFPYSSVVRCKANLYTNQGESMTHGPHQDLSHLKKPFPYMSAIYHINKCNGATVIDDKQKNIFKKFSQKENRLIIFSGNTTHYAVTQTNTPFRFIINLVIKQ